MAQFKGGDRVKLVKIDGSVPNSFGYKIGDTATVVDASDIMSILIEMDNGPKGGRKLLICCHEIEAATPPATIQHEGYNYTRGEPIVPEWVKDEAWIVDKEDGSVVQLFICGNSAGVHGYTETDYGGIDLCDVADVFRPFTNEDWKWGMWAEYKGEKVFVSEQGMTGIYASKPSCGYFLAPFSEITPTTAP